MPSSGERTSGLGPRRPAGVVRGLAAAGLAECQHVPTSRRSSLLSTFGQRAREFLLLAAHTACWRAPGRDLRARYGGMQTRLAVDISPIADHRSRGWVALPVAGALALPECRQCGASSLPTHASSGNGPTPGAACHSKSIDGNEVEAPCAASTCRHFGNAAGPAIASLRSRERACPNVSRSMCLHSAIACSQAAPTRDGSCPRVAPTLGVDWAVARTSTAD